MATMDVTPHLPRLLAVGETLNLKLIACAVPIVGHRANMYWSEVPSASQSDVSQTPVPDPEGAESHVAGVPRPTTLFEYPTSAVLGS